MNTYTTIDEYLSNFENPHLKLLKQMRKIIQKAAPDATECIKYGMPTYVLHSNLVHFAGNLHHIGFYPTPAPIVHFADALKPYVCSKGAIQFPIDQPLPEKLISQIVAFRVDACLKKAKPSVKESVFNKLAAPAQRALAAEKITTLKKLASYKEETIKNLHGMGPAAMKQLITLLQENGMAFK